MPKPPGSIPAPRIPAPYTDDRQSVQAEWVDSRGHMNITWYLTAFDRAFEEAYQQMGLTPEALEITGSSTFAAEMHITYQRELLNGDPLRIETQLIGFDAKRMHWMQEMYHAQEGYRAATAEWLILHVDLRQRRVAAMSDALQGELRAILAAHAPLPRPPDTGRRIDLENRKPGA
ncbi:MAG TPA: thioesterase family protein [Candidatus Polarisedimenticolia bacterium]|jgi:acyl-CoA thioester hydrolase|nr:thioesterase family protein [Candidatus Polarisedimenticolia bacterium]